MIIQWAVSLCVSERHFFPYSSKVGLVTKKKKEWVVFIVDDKKGLFFIKSLKIWNKKWCNFSHIFYL